MRISLLIRATPKEMLFYVDFASISFDFIREWE